MASNVKLRHGNLFDGPSDLIVLPCSTSGTITGFLRAGWRTTAFPVPVGE
jgi:hypothetical protein